MRACVGGVLVGVTAVAVAVTAVAVAVAAIAAALYVYSRSPGVCRPYILKVAEASFPQRLPDI